MRESRRSLDCIWSMSYADEVWYNNCGSGFAGERRCEGEIRVKKMESASEKYDDLG